MNLPQVYMCSPSWPPPSSLPIPSLWVIPNESTLHIRWPKYWSFRISPSNEYSGSCRNITFWDINIIMINFRMPLNLDLPAMQETWVRSVLGLGRYPGEGKGYPLQYSGLENSVDCIVIVHGVAKSRTWLSDFHFHLNLKASLNRYNILSLYFLLA